MIANSAQHNFGYVAETTYGETPANPVVKRLPITGTTLGITKGSVKSEDITAHRQLTDVRHGNRQVGGDISTELRYGVFDDFIEAVLCGTWSSNVLVPGTTRRSYSMLRQFTELASPLKGFQLSAGVEFNTWSLTVQPEAMVKAVFGCIGRDMTVAAAAPSGTTYEEAAANKAFDGFSGGVYIDEGQLGTVTEIQLQVENGMEPRFVVFDDKMQRSKIGKTMVTGTLTTYFDSTALLESFLSAEKKQLEFSLTDANGNSYAFLLPSILLTAGQTDVSGESDVTVKIPFSAIYETGASNPNALKITRIPD